MKIKDIQIDGFGVWTGLSVESMNESMTLFYGPNEAGKTTLMQFLRAMLYGFTPERRGRYLPPLHGGTPGGAMRVTGPGGGYEIRRHSQAAEQGVTGQLTVTGQDGLSQGQHRLGALLGQIDEPIFTNVFAIGIRELQELSTLDDTAAADELYKLSSGLDRVSLVDVLRSLRGGRADLVGGEDHDEASDRLSGLLTERDQLRDEVDRLTRGGRRWSELATQRRAQQSEIEQLTDRIGAWEKESRCVETATSVFDAWRQREEIAQQIDEIETEAQLPEDAPGQLIQIESMMEERKGKLEDVKSRRRDLRDKAEQLPVSRRMVDLQGRIEAASEQATWVEALEEQVDRLDVQIEKARKQLDADAERIGLDEDERLALADGDTSYLPDLSRQTLASLSGPAKAVKEQLFLLKQARNEAREAKAKSNDLAQRVSETLQITGASDLQQAIRSETDLIARLRQRIQLNEHLEKLRRHYRDLEKESVALTTDEVVPIDRLLPLGLPFIGGGSLIVYGLLNIANIRFFVRNPDPTLGMLLVMFGAVAMMLYFLSKERGSRATSLDLEDCERQIDSLRRQIRELEAEQEEIDSGLPTSSQPLETRLRESESRLNELEASLPTYHSQQVHIQSFKASTDKATRAANGLKAARRRWTETLQDLGLAATMSPTSVRKLSDGYEVLQSGIRRLEELHSEREERKRERQAIAKRIETLYVEAMEVNQDAAEERARQTGDDTEAQTLAASSRKPRTGPLDQLNYLHEELTRQQHWIKRRRDLKEQDNQLKKQQSAHFHAIQRGEQQRRALWAKCGVATGEQFYAMVDQNAQLAEMRSQFKELDKQIRAMIGAHLEYEDVEREIDGCSAADLEKRWDSLTTRVGETESRIAQLRTGQGELAQEMKQLGEDDRLTMAQLELGCVERKIASVARRWQTLAMASSLMEDVCGTFERERQPETLREASSFLNQLTDGKYTRIWTPLGTNQLRIDDREGNSLPLEVLSRGTGEAVFIALRLSLAAAYARRGVMLPLVLDDVLVNFDGDRAMHAARTLQTFAELGHQVMMFTCHEHIVEIFHEIGAEVRQLPPQGEPGRATVLLPEEELDDQADEEYVEQEDEQEEEVVAEQPRPVIERPKREIAYVQRPLRRPEPVVVPPPKPVVEVKADPSPVVEPPRPKPKPKPPRVKPIYQEAEPEYVEEVQYVDEPEPSIGWAWFEREPADGKLDADEIAAEADRSDWVEEDHLGIIEATPDDLFDRDGSWWNGSRTAAS
ncbi:MAG: AAA family ATPase [Planctomycetota bacterium]